MTTKHTMSTGSRLRSAIPYLVCAAVVLSPLSFYPFFEGALYYDNHRLIEVACAAAVLGVAIVRLFGRAGVSISAHEGPLLFLVLFFASGLLSSLFSSSPRHAFFEWANFLALLLLAGMIAEEITLRGVELLDRILLLCGVACAVYLIVEIASYIHIIKTGKQPSMRQLIVGYDNYRFFNHVQTTALPMLGLLAARIQNFSRKIFWWTVCTLWWTLLLVGAGRGTMVGLAAGILLARATLGSMATTWSRHMLFSAAGGGIPWP
jgi:putative inorganic carbon (hco3(-)) transporter